MKLVEELKQRGLIELSSADPGKILGEPRVAYMGFDPTADSLQVGNLAAILLMKRLGNAGFKLIFLVGGVTGMIGDPKEAGERSMLDPKLTKKNALALKRQLKAVLGRSMRFTMVDNADWLMKVGLVSFLRDIGKHFTVNDLIKRDVIKRRLETPDASISYTEFSYALIQGYDYLELNKKHGCNLQVGGTDQWTNILSGVDLIRRKTGKEVFAFTMPLVTDSTGKKFGKSEDNAVWLDAKKTSPFKFYQFFLTLPDEKIESYLRVYTFLPLADIDALISRHKENPGAREAQETLARLVTEIVHGPAAAAQAVAATGALFGETPFEKLSRDARAVALAEAPRAAYAKKDYAKGVPVIDALVEGGLATSKSDARRLIETKSVRLSGITIENPSQSVYLPDLQGGAALLRKGKGGVLILTLK